MASVTNKDIPMEFAMFGELFNLRKKYYIPENDDGYWTQMCGEFEALADKYPTKYCEDLILATVKDIERRHKKMGGGENAAG